MALAGQDSTSARSGWEGRGLARYYETLAAHFRLILSCVVLTFAAAVAYVEVAHREYQAEAQMLIAPVPADSSALVGLPVVHATSDPTRDVLTASTLITNLQVAAAVARVLHLREVPTALLQDVTAVPVGQSNLVAIQATASSPSRAQAIANEFAHQVVTIRAAAMRATIATLLPGLRAQLASLPPAARSGPGTVGDQIRQLEQIRSIGDPTITLSSTAALPTGPSSPKTKLVLIAGLIGGLILGIGAAFAVDALDPRLRREQQLRELFDVPVLTRIPREHGRKRGPLLPGELSFAATEGFRRLRTILAAHGRLPRAILVTGSSSDEGKTTTAVNLSVALAQGGSQVILIEADLRRPTIGALLDVTKEGGTEAVLTGEVSLDEALTRMSSGDGLVGVLAVRAPSEHVADRLSFAAARGLVERARELADFVVIDSPPLTAVIDALPFAEAVDEVLVVARVGSSKLAKISELYELLVDHGSAPTGFVVVGDSRITRSDRHYYSSRRAELATAESGSVAESSTAPARQPSTPAGRS